MQGWRQGTTSASPTSSAPPRPAPRAADRRSITYAHAEAARRAQCDVKLPPHIPPCVASQELARAVPVPSRIARRTNEMGSPPRRMMKRPCDGDASARASGAGIISMDGLTDGWMDGWVGRLVSLARCVRQGRGQMDGSAAPRTELTGQHRSVLLIPIRRHTLPPERTNEVKHAYVISFIRRHGEKVRLVWLEPN